jgi:hypothetical protein
MKLRLKTGIVPTVNVGAKSTDTTGVTMMAGVFGDGGRY